MSISVKSLDYVTKTLYESKFKEWLYKVNIKVILNNDSWELKSDDFNIQIALTNTKDKVSFLKTKFNIGLIYPQGHEDSTDILIGVDHYSTKPDLVGFILARPVSYEKDLFINISYVFNIFEEMSLLNYLNFIYDQIEEIKEDFEYKLDIKLLSFNNLEDIRDSVNDKDEDSIEDEDVISPYSTGEQR